MGKRKNKNKQVIQQNTTTTELVEHIDKENVRIAVIQNDNVIYDEEYILKKIYEQERKKLEDQIGTLQRQISENINLREKLEIEIKELNKKINELERKNSELLKDKEISDNKINKLEIEINELKNEVARSKDDRLNSKIIVAIQDANGCYELERKIDDDYKCCLRELREGRNQFSHYIKRRLNPSNIHCKEDPPHIKNQKIRVLIDKLKDANIDCIDEFGEGLRDVIVRQLEKEYDKTMQPPTDAENVKYGVYTYWN